MRRIPGYIVEPLTKCGSQGCIREQCLKHVRITGARRGEARVRVRMPRVMTDKETRLHAGSCPLESLSAHTLMHELCFLDYALLQLVGQELGQTR